MYRESTKERANPSHTQQPKSPKPTTTAENPDEGMLGRDEELFNALFAKCPFLSGK